MLQLSQKLKELYVSLVKGGRSLGWSDIIIFEVALTSIIKFLSLFYYKPWDKIAKESLICLKKSEKRNYFFNIWFHPSDRSINGNKFRFVEKTSYYLSNLTPQEEQILHTIPREDWTQIILFLETYQFILAETFNKLEKNMNGITPEYLSVLTEMVIDEFEKDFSVSPKVSNRKTKGVYYSPWKIIRELTNNLIADDKVHLTVLDPSTGTGSYLLYAAERIFQNQLKSSNKHEKNPYLIIKNLIYGIDKSKPGILVTKFRLLFWLLSKSSKFEIKVSPVLFSNIREGNSLFGFINETFTPTIELISYYLQKMKESKLELLETDKLINKLYTDWVHSFNSLKSVLTRRVKSDSLIEQGNQEMSQILDISYVQFLSNITNKSTAVKSPNNIDITRLKLFHWGLIFPEIIMQGGFDICLGNPPYGRSVLAVNEKNIVKVFYQSCKGSNAKKISLNAAGAFIERSINLLKPEGRLAFILPFSILRVEEFEGIRTYILENTVINEIHDESAAFQDVTLEMCSIILTKHQKSDYTIFIKPRNGLKKVSKVNKSVFMKYKRFMIYYDTNWQKITNDGKFSQIMGDYGIDHRIVRKDLSRKYSASMGYTIPFLHSGKCVARYALNPHFFHWSKSNHPNTRFKEYLRTPKLVCTAIGNEFRIAYKPKGIIPGTNVSIMEIVNPKYKFFPIMIILNSSLINYLLKRYILNFSNLTVYLHKYYTQLVPIRYPWANESEWNIIGKYISFLTQIFLLENNESIQNRLNFFNRIAEHLVYQLYLPEIFKGSNLNFTNILKDHLTEIPIEESIEELLTPTSDIKEIIKEKDSCIMRSETIINTVIKSLRTEQILNLLHQSEKIREHSEITKKILLDSTPKMIRI